MSGMKKMEYKGKQWHDKCFCCALCKTPIGTKSFIPKNDEVYCATCYEEKFATRCCKCKKVLEFSSLRPISTNYYWNLAINIAYKYLGQLGKNLLCILINDNLLLSSSKIYK